MPGLPVRKPARKLLRPRAMTESAHAGPEIVQALLIFNTEKKGATEGHRDLPCISIRN